MNLAQVVATIWLALGIGVVVALNVVKHVCARRRVDVVHEVNTLLEHATE